MCGNDQTALAVIDLLRDAGVRVPRDVIVTGFDGILAASIGSPTLTTVRQPMGTMAGWRRSCWMSAVACLGTSRAFIDCR